MKFDIIKRLLCAAALVMVFTGCSDDDSMEPNPSIVYIKAGMGNISNFDVKHYVGGGNETNFALKFPAQVTRPMSSSVSVSIGVDNSLIEAYNIKNETEYSAVPEGAVELVDGMLVVEAGAWASTDSVAITLKDPSLLVDKSYLLPVKIDGVSSSDYKSSINMNILYAIVTTTTVVIDEGATTIEGVELARDGWEFTATSVGATISGESADLLNGITKEKGLHMRSGTSYTLTADLKSEREFIGIKLAPYHSGYSASSLSTCSEILYSNDGQTWTVGYDVPFSLAKASSSLPYQCIKFYATQKARFIRLTFPKKSYYTGVAEFHLVAKE